MNLRKRRDDTVHSNDQNKKRKLQNKITTINTKFGSRFEDLANEMIYEIFEYLDICDVHQGFFDLNKRFKNFLINSNVPIQINISTMSKTKFDYYHKNIIIPNKHRINYLHLSNPFTVDIIFSPPKLISKFVQLETLVLDNIDATYLKNILKYSIHLPKLYSLSIHLIDFIKNSTDFYLQIFRLPKLKYCKLNFQIMDHLNLSTNISSPIEHFVYRPLFPLESFENLLSYLPQLRRLSIDGIHDFHHKEIDFSPIVLKSFKNVSLKLHSMNFNRLEQIIKNYFQYIEVLHITSSDDPEFLNAKRWEKIILSSMPNLRIFDMNHTGLAEKYHDLINQFNSSFWINKQWFFTHQHIWKENSDSVIFYSTHLYRRKDYTLDWQKNEQTCSNIQENNFNSVKHVFIDGKQVSKKSLNYFPHATELTIKNYLNKYNDSISKIFNQIIPLEQLTKLTIAHFIFPVEELMQLLRVTPNLHTIKYYLSFFNQVDLKAIQQNENFQYVSCKNKVKRLEIHPEGCTIEQFQFILNLFLQLEYLKVGMWKEEIQQFIEYLPLKTIAKTHPLFFLCISKLRKKFIPELNRLIKSKNLHDDYLIKIVYCDLFLWW